MANSHNGQLQESTNQPIESRRGRKRQEALRGFVTDHKEVIAFMLNKYESNAMDKSFDTGLAAFIRFVYESKVLCYIKENEVKPLSISSVDTEVREVWREIKEDREYSRLHQKQLSRNKSNSH